jgi:hypothetical protein
MAEENDRIIDKILQDEIAEEQLKDFPLWIAYAKTFKLTFLDERDVAVLENLFEALVCRYLRSLPPNKHTPELYTKIDQSRMIFYANIRRSLGKNGINERLLVSNLINGDKDAKELKINRKLSTDFLKDLTKFRELIKVIFGIILSFTK